LCAPVFSNKKKGTGLGLAIVRRIVEAHGGEIDVGTEAAPGAEFVVTLPRQGPTGA
jgi:signal transduction histidine kinase